VLLPSSLAKKSLIVRSPFSLLASQKLLVRRQRVQPVEVRLDQVVKVAVVALVQAVVVAVAEAVVTLVALVDTVV